MCCKSIRPRFRLVALAGLLVLSGTADAAIVEGDRVTFAWQASSAAR